MTKRRIKPKLGNSSTRGKKNHEVMCLHCGKHPRRVMDDGTLSIWCEELDPPPPMAQNYREGKKKGRNKKQ